MQSAGRSAVEGLGRALTPSLPQTLLQISFMQNAQTLVKSIRHRLLCHRRGKPITKRIAPTDRSSRGGFSNTMLQSFFFFVDIAENAALKVVQTNRPSCVAKLACAADSRRAYSQGAILNCFVFRNANTNGKIIANGAQQLNQKRCIDIGEKRNVLQAAKLQPGLRGSFDMVIFIVLQWLCSQKHFWSSGV